MIGLNGTSFATITEHGGLRMFDPLLFSQAQKFIWVKQLLDPNYSSFWKTLEMSVLESFHPDWKILFPCLMLLIVF